MMVLSWQITVASLVLLPVFLVPARYFGRTLQAITREQMQLNAEMSTQMTERFNVAGALLVKLFGRPAEEATDFSGRFIHYGIREHGMAAAMNGMALHGGVIPYSGTFLVFSDYARPAIRLAALMGIRVIHVMTHDSIGLGEDGPTHQPVEQTATLRMIPNIDVWRPCDTVETMVGWAASVERRDGPTCHILSRQNLPFMKRDDATLANIAKGGYVLKDAAGAKAVIIATGAAAMGMKVVLFFTFWGTAALRDPAKHANGKSFMGRMFGAMLPKDSGGLGLSKMNFGGLGAVMMKSRMKAKKAFFPANEYFVETA